MAVFLRLGAVRDEHRAAHGQAGEVDEQGRAGARHLLLEDALFDERRAAPAVCARPGDAAPASLVEPPLPILAVGNPRIEVFRLRPGRIALEPSAHLGTEALLLRRVRQIHAAALSRAL